MNMKIKLACKQTQKKTTQTRWDKSYFLQHNNKKMQTTLHKTLNPPGCCRVIRNAVSKGCWAGVQVSEAVVES